MRVMLAGGGSAGHIEPALALADALRRIDSESRDHLPGHRTRPGDPADPAARVRPRAHPRGADAQVSDAQAAHGARPAGGCGQRGRRRARPDRGAGARRVRRIRGDPCLPGGPAPPDPDHRARGELRRPDWPTGSVPGSPRTSSPVIRIPSSGTAPTSASRSGARSPSLTGWGSATRHALHFGLRPDLPVLLVTGGSQGARSINSAVFGAADWLRDAGVQVLHIIGPRNGHDAPAQRHRCALRGVALYRPDGPGLRGGGLRALPGRRDDLRRAHRRRPAGRLRAAAHRQRRAAAERAARRQARRRHAGGRRRADPRVDPRHPVARTGEHRPGGGHVRGRRVARAARRGPSGSPRRSSRSWRARKGTRMLRRPMLSKPANGGRAGARLPPGAGALRRHRRGRHVRHRADHAGQGDPGVGQRLDAPRRCSTS